MMSATQRAHIRPVHPFPARMAPSIVWDSLPKADKALRVLDPMAGSGTTLVCARAKGHRALGCDTDPLALLIAIAWCSDIDPGDLRYRCAMVMERANSLARQMRLTEAYPQKADDETRRFVDFWFDDENRRQLAALATCISRVSCASERSLLWCAFSRLIITKRAGASLAMDVSHSRPHKAFETAPIRPLDKFAWSVGQVAESCPFRRGTQSTIPADIRYGDARHLPFKTGSIDMIITSPPYLNAIDYLRGHKLTLVWMGYDISELRRLRSESIGTEVSRHQSTDCIVQTTITAMIPTGSLDDRSTGIVRHYVSDMNLVMKECRRVLKPGGTATFVVGNSSIRGVFIRNSDGLAKLAEHHGLALLTKDSRPIDDSRRYLPPPSSNKAGKEMQSRMREEVILTLARSERPEDS